MKISFVIPCYGSENTIKSVIDEIEVVMAKIKNYDYEIIAVNDCSPDGVWNELLTIAAKNKKVKLIHLAKNMSRHGALMAGFSRVSGEYIAVLDDDGQCPMDKFPEMLKKIEEGHDVVVAKYTEYKQKIWKSFGTLINRKMTESIMGKPKDICFSNFGIMRRYVVDEIVKYKNPYPYVTGLILRTTRDIVNVEMEERTRIAGGSNFTLKKCFDLWMNGFTAFSVKPLRISSILGVITAGFGFIYGLIIIITKLSNPEAIDPGYSSIVALLLFVGGMIMLMLGMIGEYVGRIYISINNSPQYVIKEEVNFEKKN